MANSEKAIDYLEAHTPELAEALIEAITTKKSQEKVSVRSLREINKKKELITDERGYMILFKW